MNRTFTLCFSLYPIALPFGYVLIYTFYHYAVPDANSNLASTERLFDGTADSAGLYNLSKSIRGFRVLIFTILCGNGEYYTALIPVASVVTNIQLFYISNTVYVDYADMWYNSGISVKFENDITFTVVNQYHKTWLTPVIAAVDGLH